MSFEKIKKEDWLKLSKEEQDYYTLKFNKDVEKRKIVTLAVTRGLALLCIFGLIFIGYAQLQSAKGYSQTMEKYGDLGYCYLCGKTTLRQCDCQYFTTVTADGKDHPIDFIKESENAANYNIKECKRVDGLYGFSSYLTNYSK